MTRRMVRMPSKNRPLLDVFSAARRGPSERLSIAQIEQIRRTARRVPEVMVKVTGGARSLRALAAHIAYISHDGEVEIVSDRNEPVRTDAQKEFLESWHLELSAGQYRSKPTARSAASGIKLVHNVVLAMPAGTPPDKVLAAAKNFARDKFAGHRYVMALHTHQRNPHVHLVVKAEREIEPRRLHIDKAMLRDWREDFARLMREQGIAANATSRAARGQTKRAQRDAAYRAKARRSSYALRDELQSIAREFSATGTIRDPKRGKLLETRRALVAGWNALATRLEAQGEVALGGDVRYFVKHLPAVMTDRERLASELVRIAQTQRAARTPNDERTRDPTLERTR
ncbi:MAG TPA: relaxase/mobilization nuclease domain-containing protein [Steroidobacteraceae bacterium]|nr:relaxase/mobilization nuclease domain-containing protein [Steroidobacteraceae bacterium]